MSEKRYNYFSLEKLKIGDEEEYAPNLWTAIPDSCVGFMASASKRYRRPIAEPTIKESLMVENGGEVGTPRCDAEGFEVWTKEYENVEVVPLEFARQLERELNKTIARRDALHARNLECVDEVVKAEKERDEWRDLAGRLAAHLAEAAETQFNSLERLRALAAYELKAKEGA